MRLSLVLAPFAALVLAAGTAVAQPHHPPCGGGMPSPEHHAQMVEHISQALGLDAAQRAKLEQLHEQRRATYQPLVDREAELRGQLEAALDRGASPAAIGKLAIAAHKVRKELKVAHDGMQAEVEKLLTPDQVKKLRALKAQFGH